MGKRVKSFATVLVMGMPAWVVAVGVLREEPASLVIRTSDPDVTVAVGGREFAPESSTLGPIEVAPGEHLVRVTRDGEPLYSERVSVASGERKEVWARFEPAAVAATTPDLGAERSRVGSAARIGAVGFAGEGRLGLAADEVGTLRFWDLTGGGAERVIDAHRGTIDAVAVFDDGRGMLSVAADAVLRVWDVAAGRERGAIRLGPTERISALAVTPDGRLAAVGDEHAAVRVIDLASGREAFRVQTEKTSTGSLAFTPDGRTLVVGLTGGDRGPHPIDVRDAATGRLIHRLSGHAGPVWGVACLPDGRRAVSAGGDRALKVWDLTTGRELANLGSHPGAARCLAVSSDGRLALVGTGHRWAAGWQPAASYGVQVWDLTTGRNLGRFATDAAVCSVALSPDGRRALAAGEDHVVRTWDMPAASPAASAASLSARDATPASTAPAVAPVAGSEALPTVNTRSIGST